MHMPVSCVKTCAPAGDKDDVAPHGFQGLDDFRVTVRTEKIEKQFKQPSMHRCAENRSTTRHALGPQSIFFTSDWNVSAFCQPLGVQQESVTSRKTW
jgi:hypothetical protein